MTASQPATVCLHGRVVRDCMQRLVIQGGRRGHGAGTALAYGGLLVVHCTYRHFAPVFGLRKAAREVGILCYAV